MKKILSLFLIFATLLTWSSAVFAEDTSVKDELLGIAEDRLLSYYFYAHCTDGDFAEGDAPNLYSLLMYFGWDIEIYFDEYVTETDEYGWPVAYSIPADKYEALIGSEFLLTDALLDALHSSEYYKTDGDEPYYYLEHIGGFGGAMLPEIALKDCEIRDDGALVCRAYLANPGEEIYDEETGEFYFDFYVPAEGDVEGEDYIIIPFTTYYIDEETYEINEYFFYTPAELVGGYECVLVDDGEGWKYSAYSYIDGENVPFADSLEYSTDKDTENAVYLGNGCIYISENDLDAGAVISCTLLDPYDLDPSISKALEGLGTVYDVSVYSGSSGDVPVQIDSPIPVTAYTPYDAREVRMYTVSADGVVRELEGEFDIRMGEFYTEFDSLTTVAMVYDPLDMGDSNADGKVNLQDASAMLKYIAGWDTFASEYASDTNFDERITLIDVSNLLKYLANWDVELTPPSPEF